MNGIQTQSESYVDLLPETERLVADGVTHLRLMPQAVNMAAVASAFRAALDGRLALSDAEASLRDLCGGTSFSNGFYHGRAGYRRIASAATA